MIARIAKWIGVTLGAAIVLLGGYVGVQTLAFSSSMKKVYAVPVPSVAHSTDSAAIARGKHLAESVAGCASGDCHGSDLGGGTPVDAGPLGKFAAPNITPAGMGAIYSDGELARLIRHGLKRDGTSVRFMPSQEFSWLPDSDVTAILSYVRSVASVDRASGAMDVGLLGKVLDRHDMITIDVARRIDHEHEAEAPAPAPDAAYGAYLARSCYGCHGETLGGGRIPGAPPSMAVPLNLTPDATGLAGWTYEDFVSVMSTGTRKDGRKLDPMMPVQAIQNMDETERRALFAFLQSLPPRPFGDR